MFNTRFSVESTLSSQGEMGPGFRVSETKEETRVGRHFINPTSYPCLHGWTQLIATVSLLPHEAGVQLMYWSDFLDETNATQFADHFRMCVLQVLSDPSISLADIMSDW